MLNCQDLEDTPLIRHVTSLEHNLLDTKNPLEATQVKEEPLDETSLQRDTANKNPLEYIEIISEPLDVTNLKHEPEETFFSDSEDFMSKTSFETVGNGLLVKENVKIVDIQDILNKKSTDQEIIGTQVIPKIEDVTSPSSKRKVTDSSNVALPTPIIFKRNEKSTNNLKLCVPDSQNDLNHPDESEISDPDILKSGTCLQCKKCKQIVSDITAAKHHDKCPEIVVNYKKFNCAICNDSYKTIDALKHHVKIGHPGVKTYQNAAGNLFVISKPSNSRQHLQPEIVPASENSQNDSILSRFKLVNKNVDNLSTVELQLSAPSSSNAKLIFKNYESKFISPSHEEFYKHFCQSHLKIEDSVTMGKTLPTLLLPKILTSSRLKCSQCGKKYKTTVEFHKHMNTNHIDCDTYQCKVCQYTKNCRLDEFLQHLCTHVCEYLKPFSVFHCEECEMLSNNILKQYPLEITFQLKNITIERKKSLSKGVYFRYRISQCQFSPPKIRVFSCWCSDPFETEAELNRHLVDAHVDCVFRKCCKCDTECYNMYMYYKHMNEMHKSCLLADLDFRKQKVELNNKNNEFVFTCFCSKTFINSCSLQLHVCQQHTFIEKYSINSEELQCPICDVVFLDQKLFYAHCVPYTSLLLQIGDCPMGKELQLKEEHDRGECCRICNTAQKSIEDHVVNEHNVRMVHCSICKSNISCEAVSHLKTCLKRSQLQEFNCPICGLICGSFNMLIKHIGGDLHYTQPRHQCKFCFNFFYKKFNLVSHMMNAKCDLCDLYFCNAKNLEDHCKVVHGC